MNQYNITCKVCSDVVLAKSQRKAYCSKVCKNASRYVIYSDRYRGNTLQKTYGISLATFDKKVNQQNNLCALCQKPEKYIFKSANKPNALCVDHDHATGQIRDLLCRSCNLIVGYVENHTDLVKLAFDYLENHRAELKKTR